MVAPLKITHANTTGRAPLAAESPFLLTGHALKVITMRWTDAIVNVAFGTRTAMWMDKIFMVAPLITHAKTIGRAPLPAESPFLLTGHALKVWDALDGCDCECGVWDPDCDVDGQYLYGCPSQDYTCQYNWSSPPSCREPVPADWTCPEGYYNALDGCDCECGVWDPDCDVDGQYLYGCPSQDYTCQNNWSSPPTC